MMYNQILRREISRQRPVLPFSLRVADMIVAPFSNTRSVDKEMQNTGPPPQPVATSLEDNPFYAKYQAKLEKVKQNGVEPGAKSVDVIDDPTAAAMKQMADRYTEAEKQAESPIEAIASSRRTSLSDVVKLEMMESLPPDEIRDVWMRHHRDKEHCIYAVMEDSEYGKLFDIATQYPVFLFPLPKMALPADGSSDGQGYQLFLSRFKDHTFFLTPLAEYQRHGESAVPTLVISHFPELAQDKHIVLMNGNYDPASLNALEVQCLANEIKLFYSGSDKRKLLLLHTMNKEPERFNYMDVIKEIESC